MPQGRILLKSICQSKKLAGVRTDGARLLYTWLIPNLDINGCYSGDPEVIRGKVFTRLKKTSKVIGQYLENLAQVGLLILYEAGGDIFLHIPDFAARQPRLNPEKEAKPTIPMPTPEQLQTNSGLTLLKVKESKVKSKESKYSAIFLIFWKEYPTRWIPESDKHVKIGKDLAWERWRKIGDDTHRHILGIISQMKSGKAVPDPWRWLRDKKWKDFETSEPKPDPKAKAEQLEQQRQKVRDEKGKYYREKTTEKLKEDLKSYGCFSDRWLIKEILAEKEGK